MRGLKKELWENLMVVWEEWPSYPGCGPWFLSRVINHNASANPSAPKSVSYSEIAIGLTYDDTISAESKEAAMLRYAASGRAKGAVWSIAGGKQVEAGRIGARYELVREDF